MMHARRNNGLLNEIAIYFALIAFVITLSPFTFQFNEIQSFSWSFRSFDAFSNLFLLFPIGACIGLKPSSANLKQALWCLLLGFLLSVIIEVLQLFLLERTSQYWDLICNALSALLGWFIGALLRLLFSKREDANVGSQLLMCAVLSIGISLLVRMISEQAVLLVSAANILLIVLGSFTIALLIKNQRFKNQEFLALRAFVACFAFNIVFIFRLFAAEPASFILISLLSASVCLVFTQWFIKAQHTLFKNIRSLGVLLAVSSLCGLMAWEIYEYTITCAVTCIDKANAVTKAASQLQGGKFVIKQLFSLFTLVFLVKYWTYKTNNQKVQWGTAVIAGILSLVHAIWSVESGFTDMSLYAFYACLAVVLVASFFTSLKQLNRI
ncbi:VanZ family protein [Glaciecola siphonariae]|uniref:VanZ family protein n=1 Tax=Glaciecola siphonariae TaxID=521012 RepID=A0ABV9LZI8_9ALTE